MLKVISLFIFFFIKNFLYILLLAVGVFIPLLLTVAFVTLLERKVISSSQRRLGPNNQGFLGLAQPIADGVKLFFKETIFPQKANKIIFLAAPVLLFFFSLLNWLVIPFNYGVLFADIDLGVLYLLVISSLSVYGIILAGWSSNSKYAFLGALRSAAQMIAYEISIGLIILSLLVSFSSLNLSYIVFFQESIWFIIPHIGSFILLFISVLAETNRAPFDLPEAEAELVSGYNVEYSAMSFALFFLAEYANIILISTLLVLLFFGGFNFFFFSTVFFIVKILLIIILFILVRTTLPRFRFDQLMFLGWKLLLPASLGLVCINIIFQIKL